MKPRRLKLDSGVWRYIIPTKEGKRWYEITVFSPAGKRFLVPWGEVFTTCMCSCPPDYQCFGKGFSPYSLRRYIENNILVNYA